MNIAVLGAGMVGSAMALDLCKRHQVTSLDANLKRLEPLSRNGIQTRQVDLQEYDRYGEWLQDVDLVVTAVPGFMGFRTLEAVIRCRKPVADISFFPESALQLDDLAREMGVTVITDVGVAPGMSNLILGYYNERMEVRRFCCYVGGLPVERRWPFEYKAPFSPIDVLEEYTRPARLKVGGQVITRAALSDRELLYFDHIGTLEAFNTDGLRSLLDTMPHIPDMLEKTLRYPGHADLILALRAAGFFDQQSITLANGETIIPMEATAAMLMREWKLEPGERELTVMQVSLEGKDGEKHKTVQYYLLDYFDEASKVSSMARTTGYTCTAAAELIMGGLFTRKGVFPPERVGADAACFDFVLAYLRERGVMWKCSEGPLHRD